MLNNRLFILPLILLAFGGPASAARKFTNQKIIAAVYKARVDPSQFKKGYGLEAIKMEEVPFSVRARPAVEVFDSKNPKSTIRVSHKGSEFYVFAGNNTYNEAYKLHGTARRLTQKSLPEWLRVGTPEQAYQNGVDLISDNPTEAVRWLVAASVRLKKGSPLQKQALQLIDRIDSLHQFARDQDVNWSSALKKMKVK